MYFMNNGYQVFGLDKDPDSIRMIKFIAASKGYDKKDFQVGPIEDLPYPDNSF